MDTKKKGLGIRVVEVNKNFTYVFIMCVVKVLSNNTSTIFLKYFLDGNFKHNIIVLYQKKWHAASIFQTDSHQSPTTFIHGEWKAFGRICTNY
ncbi:hypothetical protein V1478_004550 [Vespula squamosa]|uniref:Uncharacterized protein n=1 Tax=Vespula squamosa TaxID=30214 RepID=A0ABD2BGH3_VESSQ